MTQRCLDRAVAGATGESLRTVRRLGFSLPVALPDGHDSDDLGLVVDCPFCRRPVPYVGPAGDGSTPPGECLDCDVYFDHDPGDVYAARRLPALAAG